jgi:amino acid adenylation domain-containing protein
MPSTTENKVHPPEARANDVTLRGATNVVEMPPHSSVCAWFSAQAAMAPAEVALVEGHTELSYAEVDFKSNQLAHRLRANGVEAETVVGLCCNHSPNLIIGILGVWKAGGAYLPLDPSLPAARMRALLDDAQAPLLLAEQSLENDVCGKNRQLLLLDRDSLGPSATPHTTAGDEFAVRPDGLAYVIYTSGSTGTPKGVEVTHRNLLNLVEWHQAAFHVTAADRAPQLASLSFDAAVWEIWPYLTAGARLYFVPEQVRTVPDRLRDWLLKEEITIGFVPTMLAESLIALDWPAKTSLRLMLTGADALHRYPPPDLPFQLVNNYGPTECTVVTTSGTVPSLGSAAEPPSIGRPISNVEVYVFDEQLRPVSPNQVGELFIGGAGVARGYRNRPDLTAERFIRNPLRPDTHDRLYRTGDLVRLLRDGQVRFVGRTDDQVKISGFRIEPNEIAHALMQNEEIQSSYVTTREDVPGSKRLVAYVVARPGVVLRSSALRAYLQEQLPSYMIPGQFVELRQLPLLTNGKIDRAALPSPNSANLLTDTPFVAPHNPIEERITAILSNLLGADRVSVEDNFFMLGGHSLLGTQLIGRVRDAFGVELSLRTVFEAATVSQLSLEVEKLLLAKLHALTDQEAQQLLEATERDRLASSGGTLSA